jgi:hypothetical protein
MILRVKGLGSMGTSMNKNDFIKIRWANQSLCPINILVNLAGKCLIFL